MLRPAKLLALLGWSDLELSLAAEDVYLRACPRPVTRTPSRVSLHSPPGGELWPDFHRLEHCRYRLHELSQSLRTLPTIETLEREKHYQV